MMNSESIHNQESPSRHFEVLIRRHALLMQKIVINLLDDNFDTSKYQKLGEGQIAKVFTIGEHTRPCCIKVIKHMEDRGGMQIGYSVHEEYQMQLRLTQKNPNGVSVPQPYALARLPEHDVEYFMMERIDGVSLQDIFERGADVPPGFDFTTFFDALENFIQALNNSNIYHRDLHPGNVMIDSEGKPWVIDFGAAKEVNSDNPFQEERADGTVATYSSDTGWVNRMRTMMMKHLTNNDK